jgi:NADPH2:quinone reductase
MLEGTMKAIVVHAFGGPKVLQLEEVPDLQPGPTQVLIRNRAAGVNPADTYMRTGNYARKPELPYTPGMDGAGVVERIGANVKRARVGDRVYVVMPATGTYAEQFLCEESGVYPLPEHVSFSEGAAVSVAYGTAFRALFHKGQARGGETVFIHGASGGVGIATVQLARAAGLRVIGTASTDQGKKLVEHEGAHQILDHSSSDYLDQAMALTGGRGMDVIIEMLANVNLGKDLTILAHAGRLVIVGSRGTVEINPRDAMGREAVIHGMTLWGTSPADMASIHAAVGAGLENKSLRPVVGREFPLSEAAQAHEAVMKSGAYGKIVLLP